MKTKDLSKISGMNASDHQFARDLLYGEHDGVGGEMTGGFASNRSVGLSWVLSKIMVYCYEEGLSFEHILKLADKQFRWSISKRCVDCQRAITPDDEQPCPSCDGKLIPAQSRGSFHI